MKIKKYIVLFLLLLSVGAVRSQESRTEFRVRFRGNSAVVDTTYSDNASCLQDMKKMLWAVRQDSLVNVVGVSFCGAASPEASAQHNKKLAQTRLSIFEKVVRQEIDIPDSLITRSDSYIPWDYLKSQVEGSELAYKDKVLAILNEEAKLVEYYSPKNHIDHRVLKLKQLDNGRVWQQMNKLFFENMRNASAVFVTYKKELELPAPVQEPQIAPDTVVTEPVVEVAPKEEVVVAPQIQEWSHKLYLKTNLIGLGAGIANAAVEVDLAKHLSVTLPVYYSAWNYFKTTTKFRTFAIQPELRCWTSKMNNGFFVGAHFGMAYYNIALPDGYRYQDHYETNPTMGGGLSVGYRVPMGKRKRLGMEFSLGAGVYPLYYDKFYNTPDTKDGLMIESVKKLYWGLDQASISFSYMFDLGKKGGKR